MLVSFLLYLSNMLYLLLSKTLIIIKLNLTTMTITKKQWMMLLLGAGVLFLVYWFFFRKKSTESSYDDNLMIFGNENGYTNYELDGGSLESAYGPDYGAYGSYGNESNWKLPWWIKAPFQPGGLEGGSFNPIGYRPIKPPFGPPKPTPTFPTEGRDESNWKLPWWIKAPFQPGGLEGGSFNPIGYRPVAGGPLGGPRKPIPTFPEGYGL